MSRVLPAIVLLSAAVLLLSGPVQTHYPVTTSVRFNREVAAVLNARCLSCHRENALAMPLGTYAQARPWAQAIKEQVLARRMPPWPAERGYGVFANDASLTPREREFLLSWVDGGAPEGEGTPPPFVDHTGHWMLGGPDHVYETAAEQGTPRASGSASTVVSRFVVDTRAPQAMSVRAIEVAMPDRRAARAAYLSVMDTGQYLGGWTPGHNAIELPPGVSFRLPPGARIAIDVIHTASQPVEEPPQLAVYLAAGETDAIVPLAITGRAEADEGEHVVRMSEQIGSTRTLLAFRVQTSEGAASVELTVRRPDGTVEPFLWIRDYRPEWQTPYVLREPLTLPAGSTLQATARFHTGAPIPARVSADFVAHESAAAPPSGPVPGPAHVH